MLHNWFGVVVVGSASFVDSAGVPFPVELFLIGWAIAVPSLGWWLATAYLVASMIGALIGYTIGRCGIANFLGKRISSEQWIKVEEWIKRYGAIGIAIGGLTVLPYPAFTISAGIFRMSIWQFLLAVAIGRGVKGFVSIAVVLNFGRPALIWLKEVSFAGFVVIAAIIILGWVWWHWKSSHKVKGDLKELVETKESMQ